MSKNKQPKKLELSFKKRVQVLSAGGGNHCGISGNAIVGPTGCVLWSTVSWLASLKMGQYNLLCRLEKGKQRPILQELKLKRLTKRKHCSWCCGNRYLCTDPDTDMFMIVFSILLCWHLANLFCFPSQGLKWSKASYLFNLCNHSKISKTFYR